MKKFKCNKELERVLKNEGFVETTSTLNKSKKEFRLSNRSKRYILFDEANFYFLEGSIKCKDFGNSVIPEDDLKLLFWYLKSTSVDKRHICSGISFSLEKARENLAIFESEKEFFIINKMKNKTFSKVKHLLKSYNKSILNEHLPHNANINEN